MLLFLIISDPLKNKRYRNYDIVHFQFLFSKKLIIVSKNLAWFEDRKLKRRTFNQIFSKINPVIDNLTVMGIKI